MTYNGVCNCTLVLAIAISATLLFREFLTWFFKISALHRKMDVIIKQQQQLHEKLSVF
jgi:hypothetical protein